MFQNALISSPQVHISTNHAYMRALQSSLHKNNWVIEKFNDVIKKFQFFDDIFDVIQGTWSAELRRQSNFHKVNKNQAFEKNDLWGEKIPKKSSVL